MRLLIVDDERGARRALERIVQKLPFFEIAEASSLEEARAALEKGSIDVALIDLRLSADGQSRDGLTLVSEVRRDPNAVAIVVSGLNDLGEVRAAMRHGAFDFILKDELSEELVLPILQELHEKRSLEREVRRLRARRDVAVPGMVGASRAIQRLRDQIERVALSDRPVLVTGPTGAGKELVVRAIHALSERAEEPLLDLNCGALPAPLVESELFGHERGSFTGADRKHLGYFVAVKRGTLFLDEIAELPFELQAKLLRVLETGMFRAVGSPDLQRFEGRVIAATHADLEQCVAQCTFREDLYYRLNVLEVQVPALEERREDIPALIAHFARLQSRALTFSQEAIDLMRAAPWPGNVRQLRNVIDRLAVFAPDGPIRAEAITELSSGRSRRDLNRSLSEFVRAILRLPDRNKLALCEATLVEEAMRLSDGNKAAAARLLGVHRKVVERRLERGDGGEQGLMAEGPDPAGPSGSSEVSG